MNMTYQQAMAFLAKAKCTNTGRPVAHKTRMHLYINTYAPPSAVLRYHNICIVEWMHDYTCYTNGGNMTRTTKSRLNDYLPNGYRIIQVKGQWVITNPDLMLKKWLSKYFILKFTPEGELTSTDGL